MFKRHPKQINDLTRQFLRNNGLETPWLQHRVINAWEEIAGPMVASYTEQKDIRNQTLWIKLTNPALRADLQMRRSELVAKLNNAVEAQIITDLRFY